MLNPDGSECPLQLEGEFAPAPTRTRVLDIREPEQRFLFVNLPQAPAVSALRGFSAPVKLKQDRSAEELAFLFSHDPDSFNRWDAGQQLATQAILQKMHPPAGRAAGDLLIEAYRSRLAHPGDDLSYAALLLTLPSEEFVGSSLETMQPVAVHEARQAIRLELAEALADEWARVYERYHRNEYNQFDAEAIGRRRLKNVCLEYLSAREDAPAHERSLRQFESSGTMTDRFAALTAIVNSRHPRKTECLDAFYQQWREDDLVVGKWLTVQATCRLPGTLEQVKVLLAHPAFDFNLPNHVRSLVGGFSQSNAVNFHAENGEGYRFLADQVIRLNGVNPQIAARMLTGLTGWRRYDAHRQGLMRAELQRITAMPDLSPDVFELASKALAD